MSMSHLGKRGFRCSLFSTSFIALLVSEVFTVVWRIVEQLDWFLSKVNKLNHALQKLSAHATALGVGVRSCDMISGGV